MRSRIVVKYKEDGKTSYANINAGRLVEREHMLFAYSGDELIGVFDLGVVDIAYISTEGGA